MQCIAKKGVKLVVECGVVVMAKFTISMPMSQSSWARLIQAVRAVTIRKFIFSTWPLAMGWWPEVAILCTLNSVHQCFRTKFRNSPPLSLRSSWGAPPSRNILKRHLATVSSLLSGMA